MGIESTARRVLPSNREGRKYAPKKIGPVDRRISFRDLAKFAVPRKTQQFLVDRTGCDAATAKRWLSGHSRPPATAVYAVCADIFSRIE
jgi:hypothetical protein